MAQKLKMKAVPLEDSESEPEDDEQIEKRIKLIKDLEPQPKRFTGGIIVNSESESKEQYSTSASLSASEKKGRKEVEELERELDLKNTFSKETNRRDEDAEMNKYIDEQIRLKREAAKKERERYQSQNKDKATTESTELSDIFSLPAEATDKVDDILLHSLSKNLASTSNEKSEAMLSSQMLNGIPEVDLGINEKIRTIEMTEEAKLRMTCSSRPSRNSSSSSSAPVNFSNNFQQHRSNQRRPVQNEVKTTAAEAVVVVGEQPRQVEYRTGPRTYSHKGRASDDYHVAKFRRNNN